MLKGLSNNRAALLKERGLLLVLALLITGCTYFERPGMNEWDYKMYHEGWQLEHIDNSDELRWINGTATTNNQVSGAEHP